MSDFMAVLRGIVGMLGRDMEAPMPSGSQNWLIRYEKGSTALTHLSNNSCAEENCKPVTNIDSFHLICNVNLETSFGAFLA